MLVYIALSLTALGTGGIKPCVSTFGAEQLDFANNEIDKSNTIHKRTSLRKESKQYQRLSDDDVDIIANEPVLGNNNNNNNDDDEEDDEMDSNN
eukprot:UN08702